MRRATEERGSVKVVAIVDSISFFVYFIYKIVPQRKKVNYFETIVKIVRYLL